MQRWFKRIAFIYLATMATASVAGVHVDHNSSEPSLCFTDCSVSGCEDRSANECRDESILHHLIEEHPVTITGNADFPVSTLKVEYFHLSQIIYQQRGFVVTDAETSLILQFITTEQFPRPPPVS